MSHTRKERCARPRLEIARAVQRLATEELVSIAELAAEQGVSEPSMRRWAIEGRRGEFLDAVHRPGRGWLSSREAVQRFLAAKT